MHSKFPLLNPKEFKPLIVGEILNFLKSAKDENEVGTIFFRGG